MLQKRTAMRVQDTMQELENEDGSMSIDKFWKLKKKLSPNDRSKSSIIVGGNEVSSGPAIVKEYEKEFYSRLEHKPISKEFSDYEKTTRKLLDLYLKRSAAADSEPDFREKEIDDAIDSLSKGTSPGPHPVPPDVYKKAGRGLVTIITEALNQIKKG